MVVTYLLILTGVVGYACWRGYQLEVWVGELSKSVGQLASSVTAAELRQERFSSMELPERIRRMERAHNELVDSVFKVEKAARKPRGKK